MVKLDVPRVFALDDPEEITRHGRLIKRRYLYVLTLSRRVPDRPNGIPNAAAKADALPYVEAFGHETAAGVDAPCISYALSPGVEALDETLNIPVVGTDASVATVAFTRGECVETFGLENRAESAIRGLLGDRLATEEVAEDAATTNYLTTGEGWAATRAAVDCFVDAGCGVIAPSCIGISSSGTIPDAWADTLTSIVDPVATMGAVVMTAVTPPHPPRQ